jgi:dihydrofolate reductase
MTRPALCLIAAVARNGAIGKNNQLLVHLPGDLPRFKKLTLGCPVIMGRKTWDAIGRPLPQRRNIVVTRNAAWQASGAERASSLADALARVAAEPKVFVIGGAQIYAQALPLADELALTEIDADFDGDAFFPEWDRSRFEQTSREDHMSPDGLCYSFTHYNTHRGD